jgi:hypothetical protein
MRTDNRTSTFICIHCRKRIRNYPRIKNQQYCSSKPCQQARKNKWEKEKLKKDSAYREKRKVQKDRWRKQHKTEGYQKEYRQTHPSYKEANKEAQRKRNHQTMKIVKTDASILETLIGLGKYKIPGYKKGQIKKIVKTDALIAEIKIYQCIQTIPGQKTG